MSAVLSLGPKAAAAEIFSGDFWVVTHTDSLAWEPWLLKWLAQCLELENYRGTLHIVSMDGEQRPPKVSYTVKTYHSEQFITYATGTGYLDQQLVKLMLFKHSQTEEITVIDTKCLATSLTEPMTIELKEPLRFSSCADYYRQRWSLDDEPVRWRLGPTVWHSEHLESLCRELGGELGVRSAVMKQYRTAAAQQRKPGDWGLFSEFTVYDLWLQALRIDIPMTGADCVEDLTVRDQQPSNAWVCVHRQRLAEWFGRDHSQADQWMAAWLTNA